MVAPPLNTYPNYPFRLSLAGEIQEINAAIAVQLVFHWLAARGGRRSLRLIKERFFTAVLHFLVKSYDQLSKSPLDPEILHGLATCRWAGRNEVIVRETATYYIDGAQ